MSVVIETTIGSFTVDLYTDLRTRTCLNFLKLCKIKYYNFCSFHKIVKDFVAQTGRQIYNGRAGGESAYYFAYGEQGRYYEAEFNEPKLKHEDVGTLSMVTTEDDRLCGSEFFVTLGKDLDYLDNVHTVFGRVVEGLDILFKLNEILCDKDDKPYRDILITHTVILFDPYEDLKGLQVPDSSPLPDEDLLDSDSIYIEHPDYDENGGKTREELEEEAKDKEAKSRAIVLEMIGDLPDADCAPPDNVLFVCKLNSVTTQEDLRVIFSRFGKVVDCEIIKDSKSGESLQYGFIEFQDPKDCEQAYFKMDNVLIDDRRIHVDFSQSVAKFKWHKKMDKNEVDSYDRNGRRKDSYDSRHKEEKRNRYDNYKDDNRRRNDTSRSRDRRRSSRSISYERRKRSKRSHSNERDSRRKHNRNRSRDRRRRSRSTSYDRRRKRYSRH